ncbi:MAG: DNA-processing protein DprA [Coprobacillus sp.]|nr:DNA-processing protein DprA [Coprobacillus sp.]
MIKGRDILIYLSLKNDGDWDKIYEDIQNRANLDFSDSDDILSKLDSNVVTILDKEYPRQFANIFKPPFVLYYKGDISLLSNPDYCLSVIGSRSNTTYGKEMTELLVPALSEKLVIVSGMARGIDSIAERAAINAGGKSAAILGSGINYCYPKSNKDLYDELCLHHLVISEYPNEVEPKPSNFIDRNRLIAAASMKTLVIEAKYKSGTVSTINYALQYGRDVLCVPTRANEESMCNRLIKEGAPMVETLEDILDDYYYIFK